MAVFTGNGSAASPSFTFSSDTSTGVFRPQGGVLGLTSGGTLFARFGPTEGFLGESPGGGSRTIDFDYDAVNGNPRITVYTGGAAAEHLALSLNNFSNAADSGCSINFASDISHARISGTRDGGPTGKIVFSTVSTTLREMARIDYQYLRLSSNSFGIQFNGDTAAANALDDYEEGTFSPVPTNFTSPLLLQSNYIKVGGLVTIYFYWVISSNNAPYTYNPADVVQFTGLPFITTTGSDIHGVVVNLVIQNYSWAAFGPAGSGHREFFAFGERNGASIRLFDKSTGAAITYGDLLLPTTAGSSPGVRGTFTYRAS